MILIISTFPDKGEAKKIGRELLNNKLITCYNFLPIESAYWWEGKIEEANEILMIMKAKDFAVVEEFILKHHSYETPEIIVIEPSKVNSKYLKWVESVLD